MKFSQWTLLLVAGGMIIAYGYLTSVAVQHPPEFLQEAFGAEQDCPLNPYWIQSDHVKVYENGTKAVLCFGTYPILGWLQTPEVDILKSGGSVRNGITLDQEANECLEGQWLYEWSKDDPRYKYGERIGCLQFSEQSWHVVYDGNDCRKLNSITENCIIIQEEPKSFYQPLIDFWDWITRGVWT